MVGPRMTDSELLLSVAAVARMMNVPTEAVRDAIRQERLRAEMIGDRIGISIPLSAVAEFWNLTREDSNNRGGGRTGRSERPGFGLDTDHFLWTGPGTRLTLRGMDRTAGRLDLNRFGSVPSLSGNSAASPVAGKTRTTTNVGNADRTPS